jgi:predicted transcriptional regulator
MAAAEEPPDMTLDPDDLNDTDEGIIQMLTEGRCTPRYIAGELDLQQPYVNQRLKRLVEHGHVKRIDRGLYELGDDPRKNSQ